jgi:tripartite-type tricarboxylate transporter receptor subunit TctC
MRLTGLCAALLLACAAGTAFAQPYPNRPIKVIVPFPPGGGADTLMRPLTERLRQRLGQPVILENRSGAASNIGTEAVARAAPDGYTILINTDGIAIYPHLYASLPYDPFRDLVPVTYVADTPLVLAGNPALGAGNLKELIELARKEPERINFANPGLGTPHHLAFELFARAANLKLTHINYKGGGPALQDVLAGHVQLGMFTLGAVLPHIQAGKLRPYAVMTARRTQFAPEIPAISEVLPGVSAGLRFVVMAPKGTPREITGVLQSAFAEVLKEPEVRETLKRAGFEAFSSTPEETGTMLRQDYERWGPVLKAANIRLD